MDRPSTSNRYLAEHAALLLDCFQRLTGRTLLPDEDLLDGPSPAEALFSAPFAVVSHDVSDDPIFNYGNRTALALFEMTFEEFTHLPSRCSAEPAAREERERLLHAVTTRGYIDDYAGIRISKGGRRFRIESATVWNLHASSGAYRGQAATFSRWRFV